MWENICIWPYHLTDTLVQDWIKDWKLFSPRTFQSWHQYLLDFQEALITDAVPVLDTLMETFLFEFGLGFTLYKLIIYYCSHCCDIAKWCVFWFVLSQNQIIRQEFKCKHLGWLTRETQDSVLGEARERRKSVKGLSSIQLPLRVTGANLLASSGENYRKYLRVILTKK